MAMSDAASALRFKVALYIISDIAQISYRVELTSESPFSLPSGASLDELLILFVEPATLRALREEADDWRPMTDAEIEEYEEEEAHDA